MNAGRQIEVGQDFHGEIVGSVLIGINSRDEVIVLERPGVAFDLVEIDHRRDGVGIDKFRDG